MHGTNQKRVIVALYNLTENAREASCLQTVNGGWPGQVANLTAAADIYHSNLTLTGTSTQTDVMARSALVGPSLASQTSGKIEKRTSDKTGQLTRTF